MDSTNSAHFRVRSINVPRCSFLNWNGRSVTTVTPCQSQVWNERRGSKREGGVSRFVALIDQGFGFGSLIRRVSNTRPLPGLPPVNNKCRTALPTPLSNSTEQSPLPRRWMLGVSGVWWFATTASSIRSAEASAYMDRCLL